MPQTNPVVPVAKLEFLTKLPHCENKIQQRCVQMGMGGWQYCICLHRKGTIPNLSDFDVSGGQPVRSRFK